MNKKTSFNLVYLKHKTGTVMLMLLVMLVVGGIVALRVMPDQSLVVRRTAEENLSSDISNLRAAFDLKYASNEDWNPLDEITESLSPFQPEKGEVEAIITDLFESGYLRSKNIFDSTVPAHQWNTATYWKLTTNFASNSSFISLDQDNWPVSWATSTVVVIDAQIDPDYFLWLTELDDYPHQNKFGKIMTTKGHSLRIRKQ